MAYIVGLAGGSGSGKTSFLNELKVQLNEKITIISQDDYYLPISHQQKDAWGFENFDLPDAINKSQFQEHITELSKGNEVKCPVYTFNNPSLTEQSFKVLKPAPILLIEGLFVYHFQDLSSLFDLKLYLSAREEVRYNRRKQRDTSTRGIDLDTFEHQWKEHVCPAYKNYLLPYKSKVDMVINNNKSFNKALQILADHLNSVAEYDP